MSDLDRQATGADDPDEEAYLESLINTPDVCPACGSDDLHSASLGGEAAISCCDCVWIATIASFNTPQADGGAES